MSGWKVSSYLPEALVRVLKGLGTRVGAHGARPGEGEGRPFYRKQPVCVLADALLQNPARYIIAPPVSGLGAC